MSTNIYIIQQLSLLKCQSNYTAACKLMEHSFEICSDLQ